MCSCGNCERCWEVQEMIDEMIAEEIEWRAKIELLQEAVQKFYNLRCEQCD